MAVPKLNALPLNKHDFEILSDFRYQIRKFERFSEDVARQHGLTPLQYLLLLHMGTSINSPESLSSITHPKTLQNLSQIQTDAPCKTASLILRTVTPA